MNNSPVKSELYVALENGRINLLLTSYNLLKNLSLMLSEPGFANKLRNAGSAEEITKRLIACEKNLFSYS